MMKKALGKGLSALIPNSYVEKVKNEASLESTSSAAAPFATKEQKESAFQMVPISAIRVNHDQPRQFFSEESIQELAASIKEKGILQPMIVKKISEGQYELICGERRFRASKLCGLEKVPVVVKDIAEDDFLEWALIENIQREDLNPLEEAEAYRRLAEERMLSQDEIAKRVGKNRTTVTNTIRLLRLPEEVRTLIFSDQISAGHARALLGLMTPEHQRQLARRIASENLSVRQVEMIVNRSNAHKRKAKSARHLKPEIIDLERRLEQHLGVQVKIFPRKNQKQGRIELYYFSLEDFDRILEKVSFPIQTA
jgi:ParB family chromosome partitioning protein